jgi:Ca-activated chloride channel family protein
MIEFSEDWLSLRWLSPAQFATYEWANSFPILGIELVWWLIALLPLLLLLRSLILRHKRQQLTIALPERELRSSPMAWLRFVPKLLLLASLILFIIALARPQTTNEQEEQWSEGIDIILVLDISQSMQIQDFRPNRLEAAKRVANEFVEGRFQDRIGLVIFSGEAISYAPLTTDYEMLTSLLDEIDFSMIDKGGTAIGSSLAVAVNRMRESDSKSKVIILLSDGENTAGSLDPITAANLAYAYGIKVYTIGVGKEGRVPFGTDFFGRPKYIEQSLDETTLREIAKIGEGQFFRATNNQTLQNIFARIDKFEKAEIKETRYRDTQDFYPVYLFYAICFYLLWLLSKGTFMSNVLRD